MSQHKQSNIRDSGSGFEKDNCSFWHHRVSSRIDAYAVLQHSEKSE